MSAPTAPVDYAQVADDLGALAYPIRLELLDRLRFPKYLGDIRLAPRRGSPGANPERPAARQTVQAHLDKLVEADLVRLEEVPDGQGNVNRYVVNPPKLYALVEELRRVCAMQAGHGVAGDHTGTLGSEAQVRPAAGPRLVLVHGVYEGRAYALDRRANASARWTIGRARGVGIPLDYDPYVSQENSVVSWEGGRYHVEDIDGSKNGTRVNWSLLAKGERRALRPGDVIGVGRSLLCFADA